MTGNIAHHAARSTMFALPTPETPGTRTPVPWDPANPNLGLGYRIVRSRDERERLRAHGTRSPRSRRSLT